MQTEYVDHPLYQVVTIVFVGGKALSQQSVTVPLGTATEVLAHTVNAQHRAVEQQVRAKVATLAHQLGERLGPRPRSHCHQTEPPPIG